MKKIKKIIIAISITALLIASMICTAYAVNCVPVPAFDSPVNTAGTWWSGYDEDEIYGVNCSYTDVYGGDVGLYFIESSVGLPNSFYRTTERDAFFELKEDDPGDDENELVREYTGHFNTTTTGLYQITTITNTYTNSDCIEGNSIVELYIRMYVQRNSNDTSRNVSGGLIKCQFWAE